MLMVKALKSLTKFQLQAEVQQSCQLPTYKSQRRHKYAYGETLKRKEQNTCQNLDHTARKCLITIGLKKLKTITSLYVSGKRSKWLQVLKILVTFQLFFHHSLSCNFCQQCSAQHQLSVSLQSLGILSCPVVRAKSGVYLSVTSQLTVVSRIDRAENVQGLSWLSVQARTVHFFTNQFLNL